MKEHLTPRRIICYLFGLFFLAFGIACSLRTDLGSSPVASLPYMTNLVLGMEFGTATTVWMFIYVFLQFLILRRDFKLSILFQLIVGFLFGYMNTFAVWIVSFLPSPENIFTRLLFTCIGFVVGGLGVWMYTAANIVQMPTEGLCMVIAKKLGKPFHIIKIFFDISNVALAGALCLIFIGYLGSVGIGTVIIAIMLGTMVGIYTRWWGEKIQKWFERDRPIFKAKQAG